MLAFSNDYYGFIFRATQSVELFCAYRQTIGSLENGRYNPSIILAFKIARYFQMSIEEIFIYEEESEDEK